MLDLAYVLLVIFIIMTTASVQGIKVDLPKASAAVSLAEPKTKAITVTTTATSSSMPIPVTLAELETAAADAKGADAGISGDRARATRAVQYQKVMDVLDLLRRLDLNQVGLLTGRPQQPPS